MEHPDHPVPCMMSSESDSMPPLVGGTSPSTVWIGQLEEGGSHSLRVPSSQPRGRLPKQCSAKGGLGNSLPSSPDRDGADSDGYSTVNEDQAAIATGENDMGRSGWHLHAWICQFFKLTDPKCRCHLYPVEV